jgi:hypothetical protein
VCRQRRGCGSHVGHLLLTPSHLVGGWVDELAGWTRRDHKALSALGLHMEGLPVPVMEITDHGRIDSSPQKHVQGT